MIPLTEQNQVTSVAQESCANSDPIRARASPSGSLVVTDEMTEAGVEALREVRAVDQDHPPPHDPLALTLDDRRAVRDAFLAMYALLPGAVL